MLRGYNTRRFRHVMFCVCVCVCEIVCLSLLASVVGAARVRERDTREGRQSGMEGEREAGMLFRTRVETGGGGWVGGGGNVRGEAHDRGHKNFPTLVYMTTQLANVRRDPSARPAQSISVRRNRTSAVSSGAPSQTGTTTVFRGWSDAKLSTSNVFRGSTCGYALHTE